MVLSILSRIKNIFPSILKFFEYKIVSVMRLGNDNEIFEKMSVGDNLMLPSLQKNSIAELYDIRA